MGAIVGESLFYEAGRVLCGTGPISYYQFKAIEALIEIVCLHDRVALFAGEETDSDYLKSFDWLISSIHEKSDFQVDVITLKQRDEYISSEVMKRFNEVSEALYPHPLGITSGELFGKQKKDRTAEDMSEKIEQFFVRDFPAFDWAKFGTEIYETLQTNANSSELLYFFRSHLLQSIAETKRLTPIYENQRLIASIAQQKSRKGTRIGTLPYEIYTMTNKLFIQACESLRDDNSDSPRRSVLMIAIAEFSSARNEIMDSVVKLRKELEDYRHHYQNAEETLKNQDLSLSARSETQQLLTGSAEKVWMPVIASLGRNHAAGTLKRIAKQVFEKYGVGELKFERALSEKDSDSPGSSQDSAKYSTPSLFGVGTAIVQSVYEIHKDSKLIAPNKPLLDMLLRAIKMGGVESKFSTLLPVRDFKYKVHALLDSLLTEE